MCAKNCLDKSSYLWYDSVVREAYSTVLVETIVEKELGMSVGTTQVFIQAITTRN